MIGEPELALRDAMQAQVCLPEWSTAFYMQALALSKSLEWKLMPRTCLMMEPPLKPRGKTAGTVEVLS
jgi:hypothetical protein